MIYTRLATESDDYKARREELRIAENELIEHVERVAALRRRLPTDTAVDDYELTDARTKEPVRLSALFSAPGRSLIVYHFMFGKAQSEPCPMCTLWIDGFDALNSHIVQNVDFAVVAAADPAAIVAHAEARGWRNARLLSAGDSTFKFDLGSEDADGSQGSMISVLTRGDDGGVRHFYSARPSRGDGIDERGIDLLQPVWHLLDLTPGGRGDWYASLDY